MDVEVSLSRLATKLAATEGFRVEHYAFEMYRELREALAGLVEE